MRTEMRFKGRFYREFFNDLSREASAKITQVSATSSREETAARFALRYIR